jgi:hypothetical protein
MQRQQERDARFVIPFMEGLTRRQYELFFLVQGIFHRLDQAGELPVNDKIIGDTAQAMAATYSTASKGIIYEHRPSSLPAERLARELKPLLEGADGKGPVASTHDLTEVLRLVARAAKEANSVLEGGTRAYLELISRVMHATTDQERLDAAEPAQKGSTPARVIIP